MVTKKKSTKKSTRKGKKRAEAGPSKGTCFTIMPFGSWFDSYYETIYVPAIRNTNLTPRRADDMYRPSAIVNDIWTMTREATIILADLSGKNPNVFYELGLAHALTKPAILVTESMEDVPFDLRSLRVIVYEKNEPNWGDELREKIETSIREILDSPLDAVLPTFLKVKESTTKKTVSKEEKELISLRQDMDLIRHQMQGISPTLERVVSRRQIISYRDAMTLAKKYLKMGLGEDPIVSLLVSDGVPSEADAARVLADVRRTMRTEKTKQSSKKTADPDEA
jgi:hypothetical protein